MNKFQQEIEAVMQAQDKQMNRKLYDAYDQSLKEIIAEVKIIMEKNEELKFPDKLQLARLQSLRDQINNQMQAIKQSQKSTIYSFLNSMGQTGFNELFYDFEMSEKFPLSFTMLSEKQLLAIINTPVANIKLSNRLDDGVIRKLKVNLNQALRRGFLKGDSYEKIARDLSNLGRSSYKRALNIARTEGGRVSGITHQMSQNAAKEKGIDVQKTWVSALDNHTRDTHRALDGTTIEIDEYFKSPNGGKALQPHMFGKPSEDCNCRCRSITRIKGYAPELRRDNETGEEIDYKNYEDWLKSKLEDENLTDTVYNVVNDELKELLQKESDSWFDSLSAGHESSVKKYTGPMYNSMNGLLRDPNYSTLREIDIIYAYINNFDAALSKYELKHDIVTYRGVSRQEYEYILNNTVFDDFKSTSVRKKVAQNFQKEHSEELLVTFKIPKGTNGAYVGKYSQVAKEDEFTLNRGAKYKVIKTKEGLEVTIIG